MGLWGLAVWLAAAASAEVHPRVVEGLAYIRDAPDGGAMWQHVKQDPLPIVFGRLPRGVRSRYVHLKLRERDRSYIELSPAVLRAPGRSVGAALYHEYIHRLQELSPELLAESDRHTRAGYELAMRHLARVTGRREPVDAPREVREGFREPAAAPADGQSSLSGRGR